MPIVRPEQLMALFPKAPQDRLDAFTDEALSFASITTLNRLRYFLAQIGHESNGLRVVEENLRYSPVGLRKTFPKYFTVSQAALYAYQPQRIANRVYANRLGNGPESSGDGWRFRGRGFIQTTGRDNYRSAQNDTSIYCLENPDLLTTPRGALMSALSFWRKNGLNSYCDLQRFEALTRRINGGLIGYDREPGGRLWWLDRVREVI